MILVQQVQPVVQVLVNQVSLVGQVRLVLQVSLEMKALLALLVLVVRRDVKVLAVKLV